MPVFEANVDQYLGDFLSGDVSNAFHGLVESDPTVIPRLVRAYEDTNDLHLRAFIVEVIAEFRLDSSLPFLSKALQHSEPKIWQSALEGLAKADTAASVQVMRDVLASIPISRANAGKRIWIEEAIADTCAGVSVGTDADADTDTN